MDPCVTISVLLQGGPVVPSRWNPNRTDENIVRLGLILKCQQIVAKYPHSYYGYVLFPVPEWKIEWRHYTESLDQPQGLETLSAEGLDVGDYWTRFILIDSSSDHRQL